MPPELPHYRSFAAPMVRFSPPISPESQFVTPIGRKSFKPNHNMKIPGRKIIPLLVFILSTISVLRLLRIATSSSSTPQSAVFHPSLQHKCNDDSALTKKEFKLLSKLIKHKAPCNLLVFGMEPQYLKLPSINSGGITFFL